MKILIIGVKGFIGSSCLNHFQSKGFEVFGCDVIIDYNASNYFLVDATNANYEEIFISEKFDVCINCSGAASVPDSIVHPLRDFTLNVQNVFLILESIRKHSPDCKFINLSSAAVYGNPEHLPVKETNAVKPISPYGSHKLYAEQICSEYNLYYQIKSCNVRIFSAYGPGLRKQLFWDLYKRCVNEEKIVLFGSGKESRDFVFIQDIVRCFELLITKGDFQAGIYNLSSGKETLIEDAVRIFMQEFNPARSYEFSKKSRVGDPLNWQGDITRLKEIGFYTETNIEDGIKLYVKWLLKEGK